MLGRSKGAHTDALKQRFLQLIQSLTPPPQQRDEERRAEHDRDDQDGHEDHLADRLTGGREMRFVFHDNGDGAGA